MTGDRWVYRLGDKEQKKYTMVLRPEANPKEIDLTQLAPDDKPLIQKWPPPTRPVMIRGIYTVDRGPGEDRVRRRRRTPANRPHRRPTVSRSGFWNA